MTVWKIRYDLKIEIVEEKLRNFMTKGKQGRKEIGSSQLNKCMMDILERKWDVM